MKEGEARKNRSPLAMRRSRQTILLISLAIGFVVSAAATAGPGDTIPLPATVATHTDDAVFQELGIGLSADGTAPSSIVDIVKIGPFTKSLTVPLTEPFSHDLSSAAQEAFDALHLDFPLSVSFGASFTVGVSGLTVDLDGGLVGTSGGAADVRYRIEAEIEYPARNRFWAGDVLTLQPTWGPISSTYLSSNGYSATPELIIALAGTPTLSGSVDYYVGEQTFSPDIGNLSATVTLEPQAGSFSYYGITGTFDGSVDFAPGLAGPTGGNRSIQLDMQDTVANVNIDVDTVIVEYLMAGTSSVGKKLKALDQRGDTDVEGLKFTFTKGPAVLVLEVADVDVDFDLIATQVLKFLPEVEICFDFDADVLIGGAPTRTSGFHSADDEVCLTFPPGRETSITVTPTARFSNNLRRTYGAQIVTSGTVMIGDLDLSVSSQEIWPDHNFGDTPLPCCPCPTWTNPFRWCQEYIEGGTIPGFYTPPWNPHEPYVPLWGPRRIVQITIPLYSETETFALDAVQVTLASFELDPQVSPYAFALPSGQSRYVAQEGIPLSLDGTRSYDPDEPSDRLTLYWDLDNDGSFETTGGTPSALFPDGPAECVVVLMASDPYGYRTDTADVLVENVSPDIAPLSDDFLEEGTTFLQDGSFTDPGADIWTASVDYGDATGCIDLPLVGKTFTLNHTYADDGVYTVIVTVLDDDGGEDSQTCVVTVSNVPPSVTAGSDQDVAEGEIMHLDPSTFHDPGTLDSHTAVIDWGDGTPLASGVVTESPYGPPGSTAGMDGSVAALHAYELPFADFVGPSGDYTVTVSVIDDDLGLGSDSFVATVHDVRPPHAEYVTVPNWADNDVTPEFAWMATDDHTLAPDILFSTSLDGQSWSPYASSTTSILPPLSEGWHHFRIRAKDLAGNVSEVLRHEWLVDVTPPRVHIGNPSRRAIYVLESDPRAVWSAVDLGDPAAGIARTQATCEPGETIPTHAVGECTFTVEAWDFAGNYASESVPYQVVYTVVPTAAAGGGGATYAASAFLHFAAGEFDQMEDEAAEAAVFLLGEEITISLELADAQGQSITDAILSATLAQTGAGFDAGVNLLGTYVFAYLADRNCYSLLLPTGTEEGQIPAGNYGLWIGLDDGMQVWLLFSVQDPSGE